MPLYSVTQGTLTIEKGKTGPVILTHGLTKPPVRLTLSYGNLKTAHATCVVQLRRLPIKHDAVWKGADDQQRSKFEDAMHIGRGDAELVIALTAFDAQTCTFDVLKNTLGDNVDIGWLGTAKDTGQAQPTLAVQLSGTGPGVAVPSVTA